MKGKNTCKASAFLLLSIGRMFKFESKISKLFLIGFIIGEVFFLRFIWKQTEPVSLRAALSKEGQRYVLRWVNTDLTSEVKVFSSPIQSVAFAREQLNLKPGVNPEYNDSLENLWSRKEMGKEVVFWKTMNLNMVHRLTFQDENHARTFISAFKKGAYSPSPIGHSIHFVQAGAQ